MAGVGSPKLTGTFPEDKDSEAEDVAAAELEEEEGHEAPVVLEGKSFGFFPPDNVLRLRVSYIMHHKYTNRFIMFCIFLNVITMALSTPNKDKDSLEMRTYFFIDLIVQIIFTIEMFLRFLAIGVKKYWLEPWTRLDGIVVLSSWLSFFNILDVSFDFGSFRALRALRPLRALKFFHGIRAILESLSESFQLMINILLFLFFFFVIYGISGIQLFGGSLRRRCVAEGSCLQPSGCVLSEPEMFCAFNFTKGTPCPNGFECWAVGNPNGGATSFDNIAWALLTIFQCVTLEGWVDIMYAVRDSEYSFAPLYFISLVLFLTFLVLNLFVAVITDTFSQVRARHQNRASAFTFKRAPLAQLYFTRGSNGEWKLCSKKDDPAPRRFGENDTEKDNPIIQACEWLIGRKEFEVFISSLILLNTISLALEYPSMSHDFAQGLRVSEFIFTVLFALEMVLKIIGLRGFRNYIADNYNKFDFIIVVVTVVSLGFDNQEGSSLTLLRVFRLLRIARLIRRYEELRKLLDTVLGSLEAVGNVVTFIMFSLCVVAILAMQLFGGKLVLDGHVPRANFDNFPTSVLTLFQVLTGENWINVVWDSMRGVEGESFLGRSLVPIFFICFYLFASYVLLNLFVAVILENIELEEEEKQRLQVQVYLDALQRVVGNQRGDKIYQRFYVGRQPRANPLRVPGLGRTFVPPVERSTVDSYVRAGQSSMDFNWSDAMGQMGATEDSDSEEMLEIDEELADILRPSHRSARRVSMVPNRVIMASVTDTLAQSRAGASVNALFSVDAVRQRTFLRRQESSLADIMERTTAPATPQVMQPVRSVGNLAPMDPTHSGGLSSSFSSTAGAAMGPGVLGGEGELRRRVNDMVGFLDPEDHRDYITSLCMFAPEHWLRRLCFAIATVGPKTQEELAKKRKKKMKRMERIRRAWRWRPGAGTSGDEEEEEEETPPSPLVSPSASGLLPGDEGQSGIRLNAKEEAKALAQLGTMSYFDRFILGCIFLSTVALAFESPARAEVESWRIVFRVADIFFLIVFTVEFVIKVIAHGFLLTPNAYIRSKWNWLDLGVLIVSFVDFFAPSTATSFGRVFRVGRAFRPLRVIQRFPSMKIIINALISSLPAIFNVFMLSLAFFIIFGILGVNLFGGKYKFCTDLAASGKLDCVGTFVNDQGLVTDRVWRNPPYHFDNTMAAVVTLFEVASLEGWLDVMYSAMDITELDRQPKENANAIAAFYFIAFIFVGSWFVVNLFVGVIIDHFNQATGSALLTTAQKKWRDSHIQISSARPPKKPPKPSQEWRAWLYDVITERENAYFEKAVMILIFINVIFMSCEHYDQNETWRIVLYYSNVVFVALFLTEMFIKWLGLGIRGYFKSKWNQFDCLIVVGSLLALIFEGALAVGFARAFRIGRVFRLVRRVQGLRILFNTLMTSLPSILNIGALLVLLFFVFGIMCVNTFGRTKFGYFLNRHTNFSNFQEAVLTLFRMITGEMWNGVMHDALVAEPYCTELPSGLNDCGSAFASLLFSFFYLLGTYVLLNLFVGVILENFSYCYNRENTLSQRDIDNYKNVWRDICSYSHGEISPHLPLKKLRRFIHSLHPESSLKMDMSQSAAWQRFLLEVNDRAVDLGPDRTAGFGFRNPQGQRVLGIGFRQLMELLIMRSLPPTALEFTERMKREEELARIEERMAADTVRAALRGWITRRRIKKLISDARKKKREQEMQDSPPKTVTLAPPEIVKRRRPSASFGEAKGTIGLFLKRREKAAKQVEIPEEEEEMEMDISAHAAKLADATRELGKEEEEARLAKVREWSKGANFRGMSFRLDNIRGLEGMKEELPKSASLLVPSREKSDSDSDSSRSPSRSPSPSRGRRRSKDLSTEASPKLRIVPSVSSGLSPNRLSPTPGGTLEVQLAARQEASVGDLLDAVPGLNVEAGGFDAEMEVAAAIWEQQLRGAVGEYGYSSASDGEHSK